MSYDPKLVEMVARTFAEPSGQTWKFSKKRAEAILTAIDDSDIYWVAPQGATAEMQASFAECYSPAVDGPADAWGIFRDAYLVERRGDAG